MTTPSIDRRLARLRDDPAQPLAAEPTASATFHRLNAAGIRYCVWKGTVRLEDNLRGAGDLDLLVHSDDLEGFRRVLAATGWRRPVPVTTEEDPPAQHHYFLLDETSGRLIHIDASCRLPWDGFAPAPSAWRDLLLGGRHVIGPGVAVADPAAEAALLLLRLATEVRAWDGLVPSSRRRPLSQRRAELFRLLTASCAQAVLGVIEATVAPRAVPAAAVALQWPTRRSLRHLRRRLGHERGPARTLVSRLRRARLAQRRLLRRVSAERLHRPVLARRGVPGGGLVVAVVGSDGSGKSTLVRRLVATYASKFDARELYLGSGHGPASMLRLPLKLAHEALRSAEAQDQPPSQRQRPPALTAARTVWALALAREKRQKLRRAQLARSRGVLVICDRYPQAQCPGEGDGPLLSAWEDASRPILRRLAAIERRPYELAAALAPDLVLRLDIDAVTAHRRRPECSIPRLARRGALVRALRWDPSSTRVVALDATGSMDEVCRLATIAIWESRPS